MIYVSKMMKITFYPIILLWALSLSSCEDFEDNRRVLVKGKISNITNLNDNEIQVLASLESRISEFTSNQDIIGNSIVQTNGEFDMVIPVPRNEKVFVAIMQNFSSSENDPNILNIMIPNSIFNDSSNLIKFGDIVLQQKADLILNFNDTTPEESTISWQLNFTRPECELIYENEGIFSASSSCNFQTATGDILSDEDQTFQFPTVKNTTAILQYTIVEGSTQTIEIDINENVNEISIDY